MHVRNRTSRYHLAMEVFEKMSAGGKIPHDKAQAIIDKYQNIIDNNTDYIRRYGLDMPEIEDWVWQK